MPISHVRDYGWSEVQPGLGSFKRSSGDFQGILRWYVWNHWLDGHEFVQAPGAGDGQGRLECCMQSMGSQSQTWRNDWSEQVILIMQTSLGATVLNPQTTCHPPFYFPYSYWQLLSSLSSNLPYCTETASPCAQGTGRPNNTKTLVFGTEKGLLRAMQGDRWFMP